MMHTLNNVLQNCRVIVNLDVQFSLKVSWKNKIAHFWFYLE